MDVWLTYSLSDFLLFSPQTYYRLFELYNRAVWPAHLLAGALGLALLMLLHFGGAWRGRAIAAILAACWAWVAWAFLLERYNTINWMAYYVAVAFVLQAALLAVSGVLFNRLTPGTRFADYAGVGIVGFGLFIQPLFAPLAGRGWVQMEIFGMTPDPTVAVTLGALVAMRRTPWHLMVVPVLWCALTGATLWAMAAPDALVMLAVAALALGLAIGKALRGG